MDRVRRQIGLSEYNDIDTGVYTGKGITVAVLDTGLTGHPDIYGRTVVFKDFVNKRRNTYDDSGHGTHVCGIIGGNGLLSNGRYKGIAPQVNFVIGKVLDENGDGSAADMIKALEWVLDIRQKFNIAVLNMSVAVNNITDKSMERHIREMLELMWDYGIVVVCAAGNNGPADGSISSIGMSRKLIAVGCHDGGYFRNRAESCENYSARGDLFSTLRKPDIVAPGTDIISCNAFFKRSGGRFTESYTAKSGTSMAAPIVSGAAALFLEKYPKFTSYDFRQKITFTATDLGEPWNRQGWGMINVRGLLL